MSEIKLSVNGKQVTGKPGDTLLEVCQANGIDVPSLCHLDGLSDVGACRMCVVEVEKERRPVPACTYPIRDGLVVRTDTEQLEKYRRQILELIFTEHNHFCMFCEASGDCELQKLAYRYQMDNVRYPYTYPQLSVDALSEYLVIDHNRCILCGRCIRACNEIAASHTLDFSQRGWKTQVSADLEQPLGESSCLLCGACVQSCPTGAIFSKLSLYKGTSDDCQQVKTVCPDCGVGCELNVFVKDNNLVKIAAPDLTGDLKGPLCRMGRFELLEPTPPRITSALVRGKEGELEECSLDKAAQVITKKLARAKGDFAAVASTRIPNETLKAFRDFAATIDSDSIDTLDGEYYRIISQAVKKFTSNGTGLDIECPLEEIPEADCILVIGADPEKTNPIIGMLVRRAVRQNKGKLVVINSARDVFPLRTDLWLRGVAGSEGMVLNGLAKFIVDEGLTDSGKIAPAYREALSRLELGEIVRAAGVETVDLELAARMYAGAKKGMIIYGEELLGGDDDPAAVAAMLNIAAMTGNQTGDRLRVISLKRGANSRGAWQLGLARGLPKGKPKVLYLLLGDEPESEELLRWLRGVDFLVVQASYYSPAVYMADVVLPSPIWAERKGKYVSLDGGVRELQPVLRPRDGLPPDEEIFKAISQKMEQGLS